MTFTIVIPCYNHGNFINNALESISKIANVSYEVIIVDDGSTDAYTISLLKKLKESGLNVITQKNAGPGAARNNAIRHAKGSYIIPLDSDDKIRPDYLEKALAIFESNSDTSIVYSNFQTFGGKSVIQQYKTFNLQDMLINNNVGAACVYKKEAWELVGGYDESFRQGWEDYDLYLNFAFHGLKFQHLNIIGYDYFVHPNSRERSFLKNKTGINKTLDKMEKKYAGFYSKKAIHEHIVNLFKTKPVSITIVILLSIFLPSYHNHLVSKGKLKKYL